jgi:hypothetical protein
MKLAGNKVSGQIEVKVLSAVARCRVETAQPLNLPRQVAGLLLHFTAHGRHGVFTGVNAASRYL